MKWDFKIKHDCKPLPFAKGSNIQVLGSTLKLPRKVRNVNSCPKKCQQNVLFGSLHTILITIGNKRKSSNFLLTNEVQKFFLHVGCQSQLLSHPAGIYLLKVNNRNTSARCEICAKLTIKIPERCHSRGSGIFIVNFEHISHFVLVFLLLTLNM